MKLKDKICLITGGSSGIGNSIVKKFLENGAIVIYTYLTNGDARSSLLETHSMYEDNLLAFQMDVKSRKSIKKVILEIKNKYTYLDVLVHNAGINFPTDFDEITDDDWDNIMDVNLKGPFILTQESFQLLKISKCASIISIGSVSGQYGGPRTAHYAASKAGLISLAQVIARFGASFNIRSNTISAGLISSEMAEKGLESAAVKKASENILLKRFGSQSEVADVACFLASDESSYITAQTINVNGGLYF